MEATEQEKQAETMQNVYLPAFLEKCAERGHKLTAEDDIRGMLDIAAAARMRAETSTHSVIKEASAALKKDMGLDAVEAQEAQATRTKEAADRFSQDETIRKAVTELVKKSTEQPKE